jgi:hypothetical protein
MSHFQVESPFSMANTLILHHVDGITRQIPQDFKEFGMLLLLKLGLQFPARAVRGFSALRACFLMPPRPTVSALKSRKVAGLPLLVLIYVSINPHTPTPPNTVSSDAPHGSCDRQFRKISPIADPDS